MDIRKILSMSLGMDLQDLLDLGLFPREGRRCHLLRRCWGSVEWGGSMKDLECGGLEADPIDLVLCWLFPGVAIVAVWRGV